MNKTSHEFDCIKGHIEGKGIYTNVRMESPYGWILGDIDNDKGHCIGSYNDLHEDWRKGR